MNNLAEIENLQRETVVKLLERNNDAELARYALELHPADVAEILDALESEEEKVRLFAVLPMEQAADVIRKVDEAARAILLDHLSDAQLATVVEGLDTDDAADLLGELPEARQRILLHRTSPETRRDVEDLLTYADDTAGGIMKTEVATVRSGTSIKDVTEYIRRRADEFHDIHKVFVIDDRSHLLGHVSLRKILLAGDGTTIEQIMETDLVSVRVDIDQEEVARLFEKYDLTSIPVVDSLDRVVGRITVDDIVDVISEEATEDMLRLAGVGSETVRLSGPAQAVRSRLPWLGLNLLTASLSAATIALFEGTIQSIAIAAALMTVVSSQGGTSATQTMTLVVRGLALGEIDERQARRVLLRELLVALANGACLGMAAGSLVYLWRGNLALSLVLGSAMLINLLVAALLGSLIPLGLKALRIDPAVSSSVLVTAGTDIFGFFTFLGLLSLVV